MFMARWFVCPRRCPRRSVLTTQSFRNSFTSKICCFFFSEKSFCINSLATNMFHILEMAMRKSKYKGSIRSGPSFFCVRPSILICKDIFQQRHFWPFLSFGISRFLRSWPLAYVHHRSKTNGKYKDGSLISVAQWLFAVAF